MLQKTPALGSLDPDKRPAAKAGARSRLVSIVTVFLVFLLTTFQSARSAVDDEAFPIGIGTHIFRDGKSVALSLDDVAGAGFTSVRGDTSWGRVEQSTGSFSIPAEWDVIVDEARRRNISVLLILGYKNKLYDGGGKPVSQQAVAAFARYAEFVASHFKGRVAFYEIWNEWDGRSSGGDRTPESYMNLVRAVYPKIKSADAGASVLVGAVTTEGILDGFLDRLMDLKVLEHSDGLSIHTYVHCQKNHGPEAWQDLLDHVETSLTQRMGHQVALYVTEVGWPAYSGKCGVSEEQQAEYLAEVIKLSHRKPYIRGLWLYDLQDDGDDPSNREHHFGLLRDDDSKKPSYFALKRQLRL